MNSQAIGSSLNQGNYLDCTNCTINDSKVNSYFGTLRAILEGEVYLNTVDLLAVDFEGIILNDIDDSIVCDVRLKEYSTNDNFLVGKKNFFLKFVFFLPHPLPTVRFRYHQHKQHLSFPLFRGPSSQ